MINLLAINVLGINVKKQYFLDYYPPLINDFICTDRFGYANKYSSYHLPLEIKQPPSFLKCLSLEECMIKKAEEIIQLSKKENKKIVISYSGGVDSSSMLCIFLLLGVDKERLIILYSHSSIEEFPYLYEYLKKEKYTMVEFNAKTLLFYYEYYTKNHLMVIGNCGDMIFFCRNDIKNKNYLDFFKENSFTDDIIDQVTDILNHYNIHSNNTCTVLWWLEYIIKYTCVKFYEFFPIPITKSPIVFYEDQNFDDWACCHIDQRYERIISTENYRKEQKAIIKKFTKNDYYNLKSKQESWVQFKGKIKSNKFAYITTEGIQIDDVNNRQNVLDGFLI